VRSTKHKIPHCSVSSSSLFLLSLEPRCLSELPVLENPQSLFFLSVKNKFHTHSNNNYYYYLLTYLLTYFTVLYLLTYLLTYLLQLSFNSVAVVLTLVRTKQIRINIHKRNNTKKHSTNNTKHRKYKYTYYQNKPHNIKPTHTHTHILQNKVKQPQYNTQNTLNSRTIKYPQYTVTLTYMHMVLLNPRISP
jgi:hypothetical protein